MQRQSTEINPVHYQSLGTGLYLYAGTINLTQHQFKISDGHKLPQANHELSERLSDFFISDEFFEAAQELAVTTVIAALEHHTPEGPGISSRIIANNLRLNHENTIVEPREGKVFLANQSIDMADLRKKGEQGCLIEQAIQLHSSGYLAKHANIWIVCTQSPKSVQEKNGIDAQNTFVLFTERDAKNFIKYTKFYLGRKNKRCVTEFSSLPEIQPENRELLRIVEQAVKTLHKKMTYLHNDEISIYSYEDRLEKRMVENIINLTSKLCQLLERDNALPMINDHLKSLIQNLKNYIILYIINTNRFANSTSEELKSNLFILSAFTHLSTLDSDADHSHEKKEEKEITPEEDTVSPSKQDPFACGPDSLEHEFTVYQSSLDQAWGQGEIDGLKKIIKLYLKATPMSYSSSLFCEDPLTDKNIARGFLKNLDGLKTRWKRETFMVDSATLQSLHAHSLLGLVRQQIDRSSLFGSLREVLEFAQARLEAELEKKPSSTYGIRF